MQPRQPLTAEQTCHAFLDNLGGFEPSPALAIAVSGGADSMALLHMAHRWASERGGSITGLTVDHGLRPEAAQEAQHVQETAQQLGIACQVLTLHMNAGPATQNNARNLRYTALENACKARGILHLLTAHHQDDQAETLAMRAWRSGGLSSLSGIPFIRYTPHLRLIRPLLNIRKSQLTQWLHMQGIQWLEDPSNQSDRYERNRIRHQLAEWPLPTDSVNHLIAHANQQRSVEENAEAQCAASCFHYHAKGYLTLDTSDWPSYAKTTHISLMGALCHSLGAASSQPRRAELQRLCEVLQQASATHHTLAGLLFTRHGPNHWHITREPRFLPKPQPLMPNMQLHWDGRFVMKTGATDSPASQAHTLQPLGSQGIRQLRQMLGTKRLPLPRHVLLSLPSIWQLDQLHYLPHIKETHHHALPYSLRCTPHWQQPTLASAHHGAENIS